MEFMATALPEHYCLSTVQKSRACGGKCPGSYPKAACLPFVMALRSGESILPPAERRKEIVLNYVNGIASRRAERRNTFRLPSQKQKTQPNQTLSAISHGLREPRGRHSSAFSICHFERKPGG